MLLKDFFLNCFIITAKKNNKLIIT